MSSMNVLFGNVKTFRMGAFPAVAWTFNDTNTRQMMRLDVAILEAGMPRLERLNM